MVQPSLGEIALMQGTADAGYRPVRSHKYRNTAAATVFRVSSSRDKNFPEFGVHDVLGANIGICEVFWSQADLIFLGKQILNNK